MYVGQGLLERGLAQGREPPPRQHGFRQFRQIDETEPGGGSVWRYTRLT